MRLDELHLWYLGDPAAPRPVGALRLVGAGKGVSLRYGAEWLAQGFALSEDLPLVDIEHLPAGRQQAEAPRAVGAVDDARPDRWGEKVIRFVDRPPRLSLMEFLYCAGDERFGALGVSTSASRYEPRAGGPLPHPGEADAAAEVVAVIAVVDGWQAHFARCGVAARDIETLAATIDGEPLHGRRRDFDPRPFATEPPRPRRAGPFRGR